jgi:putative ABC transport system permease protein
VHTIREWLDRLLGTLRLRRSDDDLEAELRSHLELAGDAERQRGETAADAMRTARLRFGGVTPAVDALRDRRGLSWLEDGVIDVRHGVRALRRAPGFTIAAIGTLALGIGANTAIFSVVSGVVLRPLAYPRPDQLMYLSTNGSRNPFPVSVPEYLEFRQFTSAFADVGAFRLGEANLSAADRPHRVHTANVDVHLLHALALAPVTGRLFTESEMAVVAQPLGSAAVAVPVVLVSYDLWQSAFGARAIVGNTIEVDGRRVQVVGVMPRGADLMDDHTEVWLPLAFTDDDLQARNNHNLELIGRLKAGVTPTAARVELDSLMQSWRARTGITPGPGHAGHVFQRSGDGTHVLLMTPLAEQILGRARRSIWVLQAAVGLLLLIACANVANLLLARAETRQREFALMKALGARPGRLLRKAVTESAVLAFAGGALGVVLANYGVQALTRAFPGSLPRIGDVAIDTRVLIASLAVAVTCGLLFGVTAMMHIRRDAVGERLKEASRISPSAARRRVRDALVATEVALAVVVGVGAGLLVRTVEHLTAVDAGFDRTRLVTFSVRLPRAGYDNLSRVQAYRRILDTLALLPGVRAATAMTGLPLERPAVVNQTEITGSTSPGAAAAPLVYQRVMPNFFDTIGIPIVQGRAFEAADSASAGGVAIVNETLARAYWNGQNPIGRQLRPGGTQPWLTVVGVAKDVKQGGIDQPVYPEMYVLVDQLAMETLTSFLSMSPTAMHVVLRTTVPMASLAPALTRAIGEIDPALPMERLRDMNEVFTDSIRRPRLLAHLLALFAGLALLLAAIGTYGVLSYTVALHRREIGVRLALGADRLRVLQEVMTRGLTPAGLGLAIGVAGAMAVNRLVASLLFGVDPTDPATLLVVPATLALVAALACWLPARRASRLDPNVVLRAE